MTSAAIGEITDGWSASGKLDLSDNFRIGRDFPILDKSMQITRAADYALRVSIHLASLPPGVKAQRSELAKATGAPDSFLSKVLQRLVQSGLVSSSRGATGGFELAWGQKDLTVLDVVEAIEGRTQLNVCLSDGPSCDRKSWCPAHPVWREAQNALLQVLSGALIVNLAREAAAKQVLMQASAAKGRGQQPDEGQTHSSDRTARARSKTRKAH